jgi:toxin ParE1/3/4
LNNYTLASCVEGELWDIWQFIAEDNPDAATRVVEAAFETFASVALNPAIGTRRRFKHSRLKNVRSGRISGFDSYLIFYQPAPEGIHVLHVYHGARDIESLFKQPF